MRGLCIAADQIEVEATKIRGYQTPSLGHSGTMTPMPRVRAIEPYIDRAPKQRADVRCCWVCGKIGGDGFTSALRGAGYRMANNEVAHAHPRCIKIAMGRAAKREHA
jgi:hypothetical protein